MAEECFHRSYARLIRWAGTPCLFSKPIRSRPRVDIGLRDALMPSYRASDHLNYLVLLFVHPSTSPPWTRGHVDMTTVLSHTPRVGRSVCCWVSVVGCLWSASRVASVRGELVVWEMVVPKREQECDEVAPIGATRFRAALQGQRGRHRGERGLCHQACPVEGG
eukprot:scaffold311820_cov28-Tisochrysis_lutea.AAC.1